MSGRNQENNFVKVTDNDDSNTSSSTLLELPLRPTDNALSLDDLQTFFPGSVGLGIRNPRSGFIRAARREVSNSTAVFLLPPEESDGGRGWGNHVYVCVWPTERPRKRTREEASGGANDEDNGNSNKEKDEQDGPMIKIIRLADDDDDHEEDVDLEQDQQVGPDPGGDDDDNKPMLIILKTMGGESILVQFKPSQRVDRLKTAIHKRTGFLTGCQRLILDGRSLCGGDSCSENRVKEGDMVHLYHRLGGVPCEVCPKMGRTS